MQRTTVPAGGDLRVGLLRLKKSLKDDDQFADNQLPNSVDGPVATLRGK